jgi:hypothetical protein
MDPGKGSGGYYIHVTCLHVFKLGKTQTHIQIKIWCVRAYNKNNFWCVRAYNKNMMIQIAIT